LIAAMGLDQLPDMGLEQLVTHFEAAARVELLLFEEEAVLAAQVADRSGRLGVSCITESKEYDKGLGILPRS
jgi:hypothetical protein